MFSRVFARACAATAFAGLAAVVGAGIANAASASAPQVDGNRISVTFTLDEGQYLDTCAAVATPVSHAPQLADRFQNGVGIRAIVDSISDPNIHVIGIAAPVPLINNPQTVSKGNIPSNVYSVVTACANGGDTKVQISPVIVVGAPLDAAIGSVQGGSSQENFGAMSSIITGSLGG